MLPPRDLRARVALSFAAFGAALSLALAFMLYHAAHDLGQRLVDETLTAELDDYIARRERNPQSLPPSTVILQGYVQDEHRPGEVPDYLTRLPDGRHDLMVGTLSYRAAVLERGGARYYLLYDISLQIRREQRFAFLLGVIVLAMTMFSALGGIWLSRTVVAPVAELAARVRHRGPDDWQQPLADDFPDGEVGELARVFDRQLLRMRAFMERERSFSADVSHELRTALAVILSTTEVLLADERLGERQKARVARIERAARDMSELGTALLLMVREEQSLGAGSGCVVAEVVAEAVEKHRHLLGTRPVAVEVSTDPALVLPADCSLVDMLVSNLVRNAFSYTAEGRVTIRQDEHSLVISDTGKGIPADALDLVFVRHFRDMASEGAGIGLSLVKRICDRRGWQVRLQSREGSGTTVTVVFD
ncbi:MAG: HAMP domain-containing histidine kinase [Betaproteobacteria bacterium]|nr:HAMP domain-containing histidine kinase [Betaproteobacteria bacterium]